MSIDTYILDEDGNPQKETDFIKWAEWFDCSDNNVIKKDFIDGIEVSTVFLGFDHAHTFSIEDKQKPILFETMVFGLEIDYQVRYSTKVRALAGHDRILAEVKELLEKKENKSND